MSQTSSHARSRHNRFAVGTRATHGLAGFDATVPSGADALYGGNMDLEPVGSVDILGEAIDGATHILPHSLVRELFATTIIPPEVVGALPTLPDALYPQGSLVFLTTDEKLYRNTDGSTWSKGVDGNDLIADSVVAGKIAAAAVGVDELAANSIQTSHFQATAAAPEVDNSDSSVVIDPNGIVIRNGKLVFEDAFGITAMDGAGFGVSWTDYITSGVFNHAFGAGTTADIVAATLVGDASPHSEYLQSLSADIPYWVVASESGAGTLKRVADANAVSGFALQWDGTETAEIFQDVPVIPGRQVSIYIHWRYANSASSFDRSISYRFLDVNHASLGSLVGTTSNFSTTQAAYDWAIPLTSQPAPITPPRYIRIYIKFARVSGSPTVWLSSVRVRQSEFGTLRIYGDGTDPGKLLLINVNPGDLALESVVSSTGRFRIYADGEIQYSDSGGTIRGSYAGMGTVFPSPAIVGEQFTRSDRNITYVYDGTRWLSLTSYVMPITYDLVQPPYSTHDQDVLMSAMPWASDYNIWIERFEWTSKVDTTNDGANYWKVRLARIDGGSGTSIVEPDTIGDTAGNWTKHVTTVNALSSSAADAFYIKVLKTGSPGVLQVLPAVRYRLVG